MTGGGGGGEGRCLRLRKSMARGGGATETKKTESKNNIPNFEITEKPSGSPEITEPPLTSVVEFDFYTQARKVLSFRSPFDSEDSPAPPVSISGANTLPGGLSHFLARHSDGWKRHKKLHSGSKKKSSTLERPPAGNIWVEMEEYFRDLTTEDIDRLDPVSVARFSGIHKCFLIPSLDDSNTFCGLYTSFNRMLATACERDSLNSENEVELISNDKAEVEGMVGQEDDEPRPMDVDGDGGELNKLEIKEKSHGEKTDERVLAYFNGIDWLLKSKRKIYLASERHSKKRLLGMDSGMEKLLAAHAVQGLDAFCHYCSCGDMGDPLNCLIRCGSCGMMVHQRCYGVQEDVGSSWLCSWCNRKNDVGLSTERPCLLCPKQGGALKPVRRRGLGSENGRSEVEFAHLFCCQWMPEVYLENTMTMEPVNLDELKDTRKKLLCYLCKVKYGACVRCSNRDCRTSFHPLCAREARHRMEIWGRRGCEEVELHAFCAKHSEVEDDSANQSAGDISLTVGVDRIELNDTMMDGDNILDIILSSKSHAESADLLQPADKEAGNENDRKDVNAHSAFNFTVILKKLIDLGKVDARDVAADIGVSANSLNTMLTDNHMVPEVECKLVKWLKNHAHIGSTQKTFKVKTGSLAAPKAEADVAEGPGHPGAVSVEDSDSCETVCVKSVPPRRRTKSRIRIMKDDNSSFPGDKINGGTEGDVDISLPGQSLSEDGLIGETKQNEQMTKHLLVLINGEIVANSYIHPFIYSKLMQTKSQVLEKPAYYHSAGSGNRVVSHLEASSSTGLCCNNHNLQATSGDWISICRGVELDQLIKARPSLLKLPPADEVEGELIYYQQRLVCNAIVRKCISDGLVSKVVKGLAREIDAAGKQKWDAVFVSQYHRGLREAKKQGWKERRHKEAQALLAAATAAAAASSRISSIRKDILEESAHHEDLLKLNISGMRPAVQSKPKTRVKAISKPLLAKSSDLFHLASDFSKEHPRTCDICRRFDTILNPILVCSSCKVAVHLDCYRSVKSSRGPWHCELCEVLSSSQGSGDPSTNFWKKPYFVAECGLCGGTAGAFRKSADGQWIHALCAEWVLESTYRRGQVNPIEGMETVCKEIDACIVCCRKQGVCLKCSYGHCRSTFHPTCARSAGFYMTVKNTGGKLQHKAYCEKHSSEQRADTQRHGIEAFKSLKQVRVEFERLRLLCERIIKREKLKRELVLCSHDILASKRESVLSALARHPFYQPDVSSESATTSLKGYTDSYISGSETRQRSDDITVDSTVAGKRRVKISLSIDNDQKTVDSSTCQSLYVPKPMERMSFSGKRIPQRLSLDLENLSNGGKFTKK